MRTILTQDHATNLRDLLLNYEQNKTGGRIIDFTYGKGGLWKSDFWQEYRKFELTKTDAVPAEPDVIKKNLLEDDYSDLGLHDAGVFDPPYLYGHQVFDYGKDKKKPILSAQKQGENSWGNDPRFSENKSPAVFIDRVKALNRVALQCMKPESLLFVKVMDVRDGKGGLVLNHDLIEDNLTNFKCYAIFVYTAGGAKTWKNHAESAHGYWMVFKMTADSKQSTF